LLLSTAKWAKHFFGNSKHNELTCYKKTLEEVFKTKFLRVINFEKRQIAEKGHKRAKKTGWGKN